MQIVRFFFHLQVKLLGPRFEIRPGVEDKNTKICELLHSDDPAKVVCIDSKRVCDGIPNCPKNFDEEISFDEANCGCPDMGKTPVEILISLDMSIESYNVKPRGKAPKP